MILYHIHDPMCSFCWGFRPVWETLRERLINQIEIVQLLGGLAPDSDEPMPEPMQQHLQGIWRYIEQTIPNARFNHDFWSQCQPRRSTYPACRAVIAARLQHTEAEESMVFAIQQAYYLDARNPSDDSTLIDLAAQIGLDADRFGRELNSEDVKDQLHQEMTLSRRLGVQGFPSLVLLKDNTAFTISIDYTDSDPMVQQLMPLIRSHSS